MLVGCHGKLRKPPLNHINVGQLPALAVSDRDKAQRDQDRVASDALNQKDRITLPVVLLAKFSLNRACLGVHWRTSRYLDVCLPCYVGAGLLPTPRSTPCFLSSIQ